ncbi:MAG: DUF4143 domain-containing protein [Propionibacteriaceae bacterium]|jgi:predicted AAA+ superfamily ATPase|nr:DUF4143 domain-containing protein [Propionibacteriaceae bacterium]
MDTMAILGAAYSPRVVDAALAEALETAGMVLVEGARATGKTMTGLAAASSYVFLDDPGTRESLAVAPGALLDGARPRLLDEWQQAPDLWNLVRRRVDASRAPGQFLLTGSAVPRDDQTRHTGAGRALRLRMRTMSWREKGRATGDPVGLAALFEGARPATAEPATDLAGVVEGLLRPGFPGMAGLAPRRAATLLRAYAEETTRVDMGRLADIRHGPAALDALLRALARSTGQPVSHRTLAADLQPAAPGITAETVAGYVGLLERVFVVEPVPAWSPGLRSRARLRTSPRRHVADPALAAALLGAGQESLLADLPTLGVLFESAVVHDLLVLAGANEGKVWHYRDSNGHELDAVITLPDGRWAAVEVKLGGRQAPAGAAGLAQAVDQIDPAHVGTPAFRLVVTGTGPTMVFDDGTVTCPLAALAP